MPWRKRRFAASSGVVKARRAAKCQAASPRASRSTYEPSQRAKDVRCGAAEGRGLEEGSISRSADLKAQGVRVMEVEIGRACPSAARQRVVSPAGRASTGKHRTAPHRTAQASLSYRGKRIPCRNCFAPSFYLPRFLPIHAPSLCLSLFHCKASPPFASRTHTGKHAPCEPTRRGTRSKQRGLSACAAPRRAG